MNFKHSGALGDIVCALPCILSLLRSNGRTEGNLYLVLNHPAEQYRGNRHPAGQVRMNAAMAAALIPLLQSQSCFRTVKVWEDEAVDVDLDFFRHVGISYTGGHLPRWYFYAYKAFYDVNEPWLWVEPDATAAGRVVVNRTSRYRNPLIDYAFLNEYRPLFVGLPDEYEDVRRECPSLEYRPTADLHEVARLIAGCRLYVGNQSVAFSIAEGLKVPRVLEAPLFANTVVPHGPVGRDAVNQMGMVATVAEMLA